LYHIMALHFIKLYISQDCIISWRYILLNYTSPKIVYGATFSWLFNFTVAISTLLNQFWSNG